MSNDLKQLHLSVDEMRRMAKEIADGVRQMAEHFSWSEWEPVTVGVIPRRVNGRWYFKGDTIYRREKMRYLSDSGVYQYGDEFDVLKEAHDD